MIEAHHGLYYRLSTKAVAPPWGCGHASPAHVLTVAHEGCYLTGKVVLRGHRDVAAPCGESWPGYVSQAWSLEPGLAQLRSQACVKGVGGLPSALWEDCGCPAQPLAVSMNLDPVRC